MTPASNTKFNNNKVFLNLVFDGNYFIAISCDLLSIGI